MTVTKRDMKFSGNTSAQMPVPVYERIESNANMIKWCVHVLGSDDVLPVRSHAEAVAQASAERMLGEWQA